MTATMSIMDTEPFTVHPLKGIKAATDPDRINGQRLFVLLATGENTPEESNPLYRGDGILLWWSDDCKDGMKFTVRFREGPDGAGRVHPCDGLAAGKRNGEAIQVALWAIEDDEHYDDPRSKKKRKKFHDLSPVQQSHILCRDKLFQDWLYSNLPNMFDVGEHEELIRFYNHDPNIFAELCIKRLCGINSRAEFGWKSDQSDKSRGIWFQLLKKFESYRWSRK